VLGACWPLTKFWGNFGQFSEVLVCFWTYTSWSKKDCQSGVDIVDLTYFEGLSEPSKGSSRVL
jgi:hypothetical protein